MNSKAAESSKLADLQQRLPQLFRSAEQIVSETQQRLAQLLALRAAGVPVRRSEVGTARMAHSRALRDLEDLRKVEAELPALLQHEPLLKVARAA
jgi:hypothetical protein